MALNHSTYEQLARDGYGPLKFVQRDGGVDTAWDGHAVMVRPSPSTVRVSTKRAVTWPAASGLAPGDMEARVRRALAEIVVQRQGLLSVDAHPARAAVTVVMWLDANDSGLAELVAAISEVGNVATVAEWAIDLVDARLGAEAQVVELGAAAERGPEAASGVVSSTPSADDPATMAAATGPPSGPTGPPSASSEPGSAETPRPPVASPLWCFVSSVADVFDPTDTNRVVAQLQPGVWYVLLDQQGAWSRVADQGGTIEGWVASNSIRRSDT